MSGRRVLYIVSHSEGMNTLQQRYRRDFMRVLSAGLFFIRSILIPFSSPLKGGEQPKTDKINK